MSILNCRNHGRYVMRGEIEVKPIKEDQYIARPGHEFFVSLKSLCKRSFHELV